MPISGGSVGAGARASAGGASEEVTAGATWAAVTDDTWAGTGVVLGGPAAKVWAEVVDPGRVVGLLWAVEGVPEAAEVDLLRAVQGVVADWVEAVAEGAVAPRALAEAVEAREVVEAVEAPVVAEQVVAAAVWAAAAKFSESLRRVHNRSIRSSSVRLLRVFSEM
jgi:hypothetical protein